MISNINSTNIIAGPKDEPHELLHIRHYLLLFVFSLLFYGYAFIFVIFIKKICHIYVKLYLFSLDYVIIVNV